MNPAVGPRSRPRSGTPFFRDAASLEAFRLLARRRLEAPGSDGSLRVWVPECSGGEDAYSIAICLLESFGARWREIPLRVFSTHPDADSIFRARAGRYPPEAGLGMASEKFERFFVREHGHIRVRPFVRDACRFARHGLEEAPLFSRLDAIDCRETLAALPDAARGDALRRLHSALAPGGILLDRSSSARKAPELFASVARGRSYAALASRAFAGAERSAPAGDARLRESEERFRVLFAGSEEAIVVRDAESDLILEANAAAVRLFGWSLPELQGMRGKELLAAPRSARGPKAERRSEERLRLPHFRRKSGTAFPADATTSFLMLQGRPCYLWMVRDAAPRLALIGRRERDEEKAAFVGDVVHELRTPIAVIRGSVESLSQGVRGPRNRKVFLDFIQSHSLRLSRLVDQLLDLSAADSPARATNPAAILLSEIVWEVAAAFIPVAKRRGIAIKIDVPGDIAVLADRADLPHVFGNLLDNAIKFTPRGGKVHIRGRSERGEGILSVRDTGVGIAPADLGKVFERFFRGERTRKMKGTGLGLSIVAGMVKANRGRVTAENDPSGGAVFSVTLPLAAGAGESHD